MIKEDTFFASLLLAGALFVGMYLGHQSATSDLAVQAYAQQIGTEAAAEIRTVQDCAAFNAAFEETL